MKTNWKVLCFPVFLLFASCEIDESVIPSQPFGNAIELKIGQSIRFLPDYLQVGFQKVRSDSRCPIGAQCIWEGIADLQLWLVKPGLDSVYVKASIYGSGRPVVVDTLGYRITLLQLDPYPKTDNRPKPSDYIATIRVSKI